LGDLNQLPGVDAVGITSFLPVAGNNWSIAFTIEAYVSPKDAGLNMAAMSLVESYPFEALGIRVRRGRVFTESDNANSQLVAIVNRKMAERYWPGQDPIGKRLRRGLPDTSTPWMTVVGEVDDVKLGSPDAETIPQVYQPITQTVASEGVLASAGELSGTDGWIVLRSRTAPEMENALRATMRNLDPQLPLYQMQTMARHLEERGAATLQYRTDFLVSCRCSAAQRYRHLWRDCVLRGIARTGNRGAHGAWRSALRSNSADPELRHQACGGWLWLGFAWRRGRIPSAGFLSV
jgi:hypothetical protein